MKGCTRCLEFFKRNMHNIWGVISGGITLPAIGAFCEFRRVITGDRGEPAGCFLLLIVSASILSKSGLV